MVQLDLRLMPLIHEENAFFVVPVGTKAYVIAHDEGGSLIMTGKYGKQVVRLSSNTDSGGGILTLSEGTRGNEAVEISADKNHKSSRGSIKIFNETGSEWEAP